ncbi:MAG: EamA family transporter [Deltaproteobacteria bacterium]|nr:EamA family transporter [Deltaproteobacteria bacterium]
MALGFITILGDYFLKIASSQDKPLETKYFFIGFLIYSATTFVWLYLMKYLKLSAIGVIYSISMLILLTLLGVFFFNESLNHYEFAGIIFAVASIVLLARFT